MLGEQGILVEMQRVLARFSTSLGLHINMGRICMIKLSNASATLVLVRSRHVLDQLLILYFAQRLLIILTLHRREIFTVLFFDLKWIINNLKIIRIIEVLILLRVHCPIRQVNTSILVAPLLYTAAHIQYLASLCWHVSIWRVKVFDLNVSLRVRLLSCWYKIWLFNKIIKVQLWDFRRILLCM